MKTKRKLRSKKWSEYNAYKVRIGGVSEALQWLEGLVVVAGIATNRVASLLGRLRDG